MNPAWIITIFQATQWQNVIATSFLWRKRHTKAQGPPKSRCDTDLGLSGLSYGSEKKWGLRDLPPSRQNIPSSSFIRKKGLYLTKA